MVIFLHNSCKKVLDLVASIFFTILVFAQSFLCGVLYPFVYTILTIIINPVD